MPAVAPRSAPSYRKHKSFSRANKPRAKRPRPDPSYRLHKQSGQAVVTLSDGCGGRRDVLLGEFDTDESVAEYDRVIAEWKANGRRFTSAQARNGAESSAPAMTVNELWLRFLEHAERHYRRADGSLTGEVREYKYACRPVREMYGTLPADKFTPLALKAVRGRMIAAGWSRGVVNARINRVRHVFKWAVSEGLAAIATLEALKTVEGLQAGRTEAPETEPVRPVPDAFVEVILPHVSRPVAAMIELQRLTGMRPGEVCVMRAADIDTSGPTWLYRPHYHKLSYRGAERVIPLGPRCQEIIRGFLVPEVSAYLFSPKRAMAERAVQRRAARKTKVQPSQVHRRVRKAKRAPGDRYGTASYGRAIRKGCEAARVPSWGPNRLRHTYATKVRKQHGLEAAQVLLGHAKADMTQRYAERDLGLATKVASAIG